MIIFLELIINSFLICFNSIFFLCFNKSYISELIISKFVGYSILLLRLLKENSVFFCLSKHVSS